MTLGERFVFDGQRYKLRRLWRMLYSLHEKHGRLVLTIAPLASSGKGGRTDAQNRYLHAAIGQIARHAGADPEVTKDWLKKEAFGERCFLYNGHPVYRLCSTSKMNKQQMAQFIEFCLHHAAENGYPVMMPDGYEDWAKEAKRG